MNLQKLLQILQTRFDANFANTVWCKFCKQGLAKLVSFSSEFSHHRAAQATKGDSQATGYLILLIWTP